MVLRGICILSALLVSACAPQPRIEPVSTPAVRPGLAAPFREDGPLLINDYKRTVASRIVAANEEVIFEQLPEMLESDAVLEITADHRGYALVVYAIGSNGFPELA